MATCFVIQPFDDGKFDKRFSDVYKPAIEAAGLEAYRVDKDPGVSIPIDSIEDGIKKAALCLADITTDNPNVWYELGFAYAVGKSVVMVCSRDERPGGKFPFDIQHRSIIPYKADAPSDFEKLKCDISAKIEAMLQTTHVLDQMAEATPTEETEGLSLIEVLVLGVIAGNVYLPSGSIAVYVARNDADRAGVTTMGFNLAIRKLATKAFVEVISLVDDHDGESYNAVRILEKGWGWIEANDSRFILHRLRKDASDDDIPF